MEHFPTKPYCGLLVVLDHPSRHDNDKLISGWAGETWEKWLVPFDRNHCHIIESKQLIPGLYPSGTTSVLLLGDDSLRKFALKTSLDEQRGSPFIFAEIAHIATFSIQDSFDRQNYEDEEEEQTDHGTEKDHQHTKRANWRFWLRRDTKKAIEIITMGYQKPVEFTQKIYPDIDEAIRVLKTTKNQVLICDIETDGKWNAQNINCIGFSFISREVRNISGYRKLEKLIYVVPFRKCHGSMAYDELLIYKFLVALAIAFKNNLVIFQNGMFDLFVLAWRYGVMPPIEIYDTMLAQHRIEPEIEKSLAHNITYYTHEPYHKNECILQPHNSEQEWQLYRYNARDILTTALVYLGQQEKITDFPSYENSIKQSCRMIRTFLTIMLQGMKLDMEKIEVLLKKYKKEEILLERILSIVTNVKINPRSHQQVSQYFYDLLGNQKPEKDPTNEKTLLKLYSKIKAPSIEIIIRGRGIRKLSSALKFNLWRDNRITTAYSLSGTDTYRLASRTLFKFRGKKGTGFGTNLQNWNKKNRECIVADSGKVLIQADQAGAEAKIVAYLCREGNFQLLFENNIKPHIWMTLMLFEEAFRNELGWTEGRMKEFIEAPIVELQKLNGWQELKTLVQNSGGRYDTGKMTIHAGDYDMKGPTMQVQALVKSDNTLVLTIRECNQYLMKFHTVLPEIAEWHALTREEFHDTRTLFNLFGHPRKFNGPDDPSTHRQLYAFRPQSTVGVITEIAMCNLQERIEQNDALLQNVDILQNGHDSILAQAPIDNALAVARELRDSLCMSFVLKGKKFTMGSDVSIGETWKDMKELKI